jgi:hypothetical protein
MVTSENLNDDFNSISASVNGYTVESVTTGDTSNDTDLRLTLSEKNTFDTDIIPSVRILSNTSLSDSNGNTIADEVSGTTPTDGAGPVILSSRYSEGVIYIVFSEDIDSGTIDTST